MTEYQKEAIKFYGITALVFIMAVIAIYIAVDKLISYEKPIRASIEDRYWVFTRAVQDDDYVCSPTFDIDGNMHVTCEWETDTICRSSASGRELPPAPPALACEAVGDDYISDHIQYVAVYRQEETPELKTTDISYQEWNQYRPGTRARLILNALGGVRRMEIDN